MGKSVKLFVQALNKAASNRGHAKFTTDELERFAKDMRLQVTSFADFLEVSTRSYRDSNFRFASIRTPATLYVHTSLNRHTPCVMACVIAGPESAVVLDQVREPRVETAHKPALMSLHHPHRCPLPASSLCSYPSLRHASIGTHSTACVCVLL